MFQNSIIPFQGNPETETVEEIEYDSEGRIVKRTTRTITRQQGQPYQRPYQQPYWYDSSYEVIV